jgi:hypothetical protein
VRRGQVYGYRSPRTLHHPAKAQGPSRPTTHLRAWPIGCLPPASNALRLRGRCSPAQRLPSVRRLLAPLWALWSSLMLTSWRSFARFTTVWRRLGQRLDYSHPLRLTQWCHPWLSFLSRKWCNRGHRQMSLTIRWGSYQGARCSGGGLHCAMKKRVRRPQYSYVRVRQWSSYIRIDNTFR